MLMSNGANQPPAASCFVFSSCFEDVTGALSCSDAGEVDKWRPSLLHESYSLQFSHCLIKLLWPLSHLDRLLNQAARSGFHPKSEDKWLNDGVLPSGSNKIQNSSYLLLHYCQVKSNIYTLSTSLRHFRGMSEPGLKGEMLPLIGEISLLQLKMCF